MNRPYVLLAATLLIGLSSCGEASTGPEIPQIGGAWDYSYSVSNSTYQVSCNGQGSISVTQTAAQFSGQGSGSATCNGPGGQFSDQGAVGISGGQIDGSSVSFRFTLFGASCDADGTMSGDPVNRFQGNMNCAFDSQGQTVNLTGDWSASR